MKARVPAAVCFVALLYCCWLVYRRPKPDPGVVYNVEITVIGQDGKVIPAVRPAAP